MSRVLVKAHRLIENNEMRKTGTKVGAIDADPMKYISDFGELSVSDNYEYLILCWKHHTKM